MRPISIIISVIAAAILGVVTDRLLGRIIEKIIEGEKPEGWPRILPRILGMLVAIAILVYFVALPSLPQLNPGTQTQTEPSNSWIRHPSNPILGVGDPGSWDENRVIFPSVIKEASIFKMWYRGVDGSGMRRIGLATSPDGVTWTKHPANPILAPGSPGAWDESQIESTRVIKDGDLYKMWYTGIDEIGTKRIGLATSTDSISWTKHFSNPVLEVGGYGAWDEEAVSGAHILKDGTTYKMWYTGEDRNGISRLGYATSVDGVTWTKHAGNPVLTPGVSGSWDDYGVLYPCVLRDGTIYRMWYFGKSNEWVDRIGYATSSDGVYWVKYPGNPVLSSGVEEEWDEFGVAAPSVIKDGTDYKMWFQGWQGDGASIRIGYASSLAQD